VGSTQFLRKISKLLPGSLHDSTSRRCVTCCTIEKSESSPIDFEFEKLTFWLLLRMDYKHILGIESSSDDDIVAETQEDYQDSSQKEQSPLRPVLSPLRPPRPDSPPATNCINDDSTNSTILTPSEYALC
jgi:hypothetical protein